MCSSDLGEFPALFVYEKGDKLVDGTVSPNKRIGLFTGQVAALTANWNPELRWFTEEGKTLLLNTVKYAVGATAPAPGPTLSVNRDGDDLVITFTSGTLQSASTLGGTWTDEPGASPLKITPSAPAKFFRVISN